MKKGENRPLNIMLVGKGGQGILRAGNFICELFSRRGLAVKQTAVQGMAQRGGSVVSQVRIGAVVYSPLIPDFECDFLLSLDAAEGARWKPQLRREGSFVALEAAEEARLKYSRGRNICVLAKFFRQLQKQQAAFQFSLRFETQELLTTLKHCLGSAHYQRNAELLKEFLRAG